METCCWEISILIVTIVVAVTAYVKWCFRYWERRNVPFMPPSLPMGNFEAPWAIKQGFYDKMLDIYREFKAKGYKYGGVYSSLRPVFVPIDLDLLKCIMLKDFSHFSERGIYHHETADPLSAHLFNIGGDKWRSLRTRLTPTFTSGKMKYMFNTLLDCGDALQNEIDKLYKSKEPVNVREVSALFTTNVIGSCVFGLNCDTFANPNNEFRTHTKKIFQAGVLDWLREMITLSFPSICKRLGVKVFAKEATQFYIDVVRDITEHRESGEVKRNDFMQILVDIKNETLRLYPIVATLERIVTKDYKIPGEDLVLKKGCKVFIPLQGIQRDPEYYPDPQKFDPDRFSPENKVGRHPCAYMPFGEGPRICIGMRFGILQAKIGMAIMLKNYRYKLNPNMPKMVLDKTSLLLAPAGDVSLDIEKVD